MTHKHTCQRQMLVGFFFFFLILSDRDLQEIWMRKKANGKHAWNGGKFSEEIVQDFFMHSELLKTLFKGKTKGWIRALKTKIKYSEAIQFNSVFPNKHCGM